MAEPNALAHRKGTVDTDRPDALEYWYLQENTPLGDTYPADIEREATERAEDERMASGWWITPLIALSLPAWITVAILVF